MISEAGGKSDRVLADCCTSTKWQLKMAVYELNKCTLDIRCHHQLLTLSLDLVHSPAVPPSISDRCLPAALTAKLLSSCAAQPPAAVAGPATVQTSTRSRRLTVGSHTFTASGAAVWNDLPAHITAVPSLAVFRQRLKTFLFSRSYPDIVT